MRVFIGLIYIKVTFLYLRNLKNLKFCDYWLRWFCTEPFSASCRSRRKKQISTCFESKIRFLRWRNTASRPIEGQCCGMHDELFYWYACGPPSPPHLSLRQPPSSFMTLCVRFHIDPYDFDRNGFGWGKFPPAFLSTSPKSELMRKTHFLLYPSKWWRRAVSFTKQCHQFWTVFILKMGKSRMYHWDCFLGEIVMILLQLQPDFDSVPGNKCLLTAQGPQGHLTH